MVTELEKQRRRLNGLPETRTVAEKFAEQRARAKPLEKVLAIETDHVAEVDMPAFLDRSNPLIAEQMTAARKKAEAAARSAMPLTGRAAQDFIKSNERRPDDQPRPPGGVFRLKDYSLYHYSTSHSGGYPSWIYWVG